MNQQKVTQLCLPFGNIKKDKLNVVLGKISFTESEINELKTQIKKFSLYCEPIDLKPLKKKLNQKTAYLNKLYQDKKFLILKNKYRENNM